MQKSICSSSAAICRVFSARVAMGTILYKGPRVLAARRRRRVVAFRNPLRVNGRLMGESTPGHRLAPPSSLLPRPPMHVVHSPLHARHDGGVELHRGALVPSYESPARVDHILRAVQAAGLPLIAPRDVALDALHAVHDPAFVEFLRTAYARWQAEGRGGSMLPSGFPARSLRQDVVPAGINGAMGHYAFDAGTPIVAGT